MKFVKFLTESFHNDGLVRGGTVLPVPDDFKLGPNVVEVDDPAPAEEPEGSPASDDKALGDSMPGSLGEDGKPASGSDVT